MAGVIEALNWVNSWLGDAQWFAVFLLLTGLYFTISLKLPQFRLFGSGVRLLGKARRSKGEGDASTFQALSTALSGTVGTGNIGGVAFAIFLGGPAALFWMWMTAFFGMATKMTEVTLSHKYRVTLEDGSYSGGPMYVLQRGLNMKWLGGVFAVATVISTVGTGSLPQIRTITEAVNATLGIDFWITSLVMTILLALVILGGVKRIVKVAEIIAPVMATLYVLGVAVVLATHADNILPSLYAIVGDVFTGSAAVGGFLGAGIAHAFSRGVGRGLFSNEAGQGSAPIAHAIAKTEKPVDEGMVALLEPFIDTLIICTLTGLAILASGVWTKKFDTEFSLIELSVLQGTYTEENPKQVQDLYRWINNEGSHEVSPVANELVVDNGRVWDSEAAPVTFVHSRSIAENVRFVEDGSDEPWSGVLALNDNGVIIGTRDGQALPRILGKSLLHSVSLNIKAFESALGGAGAYLVTLTLILFAFTTSVTWSFYGDRATGYLFKSPKARTAYKVGFIIMFFIGGITATTVIWAIALITQTLMALPNLYAILRLRKEMKEEVDKMDKDATEAS